MKKSTNLFITLAAVAGVVVGFLIGIAVNFPKTDQSELAGTIGKVNNYRNTKATEADIELKNDLIADTSLIRSLKNYMNFYYVRAVELKKNIDFAVTTANENEAFKTECRTEITALESYGKFLSTVRKDFLGATLVFQSAEETDPAILRSSIAKANNSIAQMNYRNSAVINFITQLDSFIQEKGTSNYPELNKAHDLLAYNVIGTSILLKDKMLLKFFDKTKFYCEDLKNPSPMNLKNIIQKDMELLSNSLPGDPLDVEKLDAIYTDIEKLGQTLSFDAERLGGAIVFDAEKLGGNVYMDAEKLGAGFPDAEKLGVFDVEKLGTFMDSEKLGMFI